jgi:hypothetical protein
MMDKNDYKGTVSNHEEYENHLYFKRSIERSGDKS